MIAGNGESTGYIVGYKKPPLEHQFQRGHKPMGGRRPVPRVLKEYLPEACDELIALCKQNADLQIKFKALHDVIAWNIGQPGNADAEAGDGEDMRKLFDEAARVYGWRVLPPEQKETECAPQSESEQP